MLPFYGYAVLAALWHLAAATPLGVQQLEVQCPPGYTTTFPSQIIHVIVSPIQIDTYLQQNTVLNFGGLFINVTNAPTHLFTLVSATSTTTVQDAGSGNYLAGTLPGAGHPSPTNPQGASDPNHTSVPNAPLGTTIPSNGNPVITPGGVVNAGTTVSGISESIGISAGITDGVLPSSVAGTTSRTSTAPTNTGVVIPQVLLSLVDLSLKKRQVTSGPNFMGPGGSIVSNCSAAAPLTITADELFIGSERFSTNPDVPFQVFASSSVPGNITKSFSGTSFSWDNPSFDKGTATFCVQDGTLYAYFQPPIPDDCKIQVAAAMPASNCQHGVIVSAEPDPSSASMNPTSSSIISPTGSTSPLSPSIGLNEPSLTISDNSRSGSTSLGSQISETNSMSVTVSTDSYSLASATLSSTISATSSISFTSFTESSVISVSSSTTSATATACPRSAEAQHQDTATYDAFKGQKPDSFLGNIPLSVLQSSTVSGYLSDISQAVQNLAACGSSLISEALLQCSTNTDPIDLASCLMIYNSVTHPRQDLVVGDMNAVNTGAFNVVYASLDGDDVSTSDSVTAILNKGKRSVSLNNALNSALLKLYVDLGYNDPSMTDGLSTDATSTISSSISSVSTDLLLTTSESTLSISTESEQTSSTDSATQSPSTTESTLTDSSVLSDSPSSSSTDSIVISTTESESLATTILSVTTIISPTETPSSIDTSLTTSSEISSLPSSISTLSTDIPETDSTSAEVISTESSIFSDSTTSSAETGTATISDDDNSATTIPSISISISSTETTSVDDFSTIMDPSTTVEVSATFSPEPSESSTIPTETSSQSTDSVSVESSISTEFIPSSTESVPLSTDSVSVESSISTEFIPSSTESTAVSISESDPSLTSSTPSTTSPVSPAVTTAIVPGWNMLGCYEGGPQIVDGDTNSGASAELCTSYCKSISGKYSLVQPFAELGWSTNYDMTSGTITVQESCLCGEGADIDLDNFANTRVSDSLCEMVCPGNPTEWCGSSQPGGSYKIFYLYVGDDSTSSTAVVSDSTSSTIVGDDSTSSTTVVSDSISSTIVGDDSTSSTMSSTSPDSSTADSLPSTSSPASTDTSPSATTSELPSTTSASVSTATTAVVEGWNVLPNCYVYGEWWIAGGTGFAISAEICTNNCVSIANTRGWDLSQVFTGLIHTISSSPDTTPNGECICGTNFDVNNPTADNSFCNWPCAGDSSELCGSDDYVIVYLSDLPSTGTDPSTGSCTTEQLQDDQTYLDYVASPPADILAKISPNMLNAADLTVTLLFVYQALVDASTCGLITRRAAAEPASDCLQYAPDNSDGSQSTGSPGAFGCCILGSHSPTSPSLTDIEGKMTTVVQAAMSLATQADLDQSFIYIQSNYDDSSDLTDALSALYALLGYQDDGETLLTASSSTSSTMVQQQGLRVNNFTQTNRVRH